MHELSITQQLVDHVVDAARGARVLRVYIEIGSLCAVMPEAVRFCFDMCAAGTVVEGAHLEIDQPDGRARCRVCGDEVAFMQPVGRCACGASDFMWLSGDELRLTAIEIE